MDCGTAKGWIGDYVDGVLAADRASSFEEHIHGCRDCSLDLAAERRVEEFVSTYSVAQLSAEFTPHLLARYREERRSADGLKWSTLVGVAYGFSTVMLALAFGNLLRKTGEFASDLAIVPNVAGLAAGAVDLLTAVELLPIGAALCALVLTWALYLWQDPGRLNLRR